MTTDAPKNPFSLLDTLADFAHLFAQVDPGQTQQFKALQEGLRIAKCRLMAVLDRAECVIASTRENLAQARPSPQRDFMVQRVEGYAAAVQGVWTALTPDSIRELLKQQAALEAAMDTIDPKSIANPAA